MTLNLHPKRWAIKNRVIGTFKDHVSSGKAAFFQKYGMDFVIGRPEGSYIWDIATNGCTKGTGKARTKRSD